MDRPERRRTPFHDWLEERIDPLRQLEEEANACVFDEQPLVRDNEYRYDTENTSQWCPGGLSRYQKRKLQRLRIESSNKKILIV